MDELEKLKMDILDLQNDIKKARIEQVLKKYPIGDIILLYDTSFEILDKRGVFSETSRGY